MKTFIKWLGNKSHYTKYIIPYFPKSFHTYIEPFVGSGAIFISLQPERYIINDKHTELIYIWKLVKSNPILIWKIYHNLILQFNKLKDVKDQIAFSRKLLASISPHKLDVQKAVTYLFLKNCSYMGIMNKDDELYFHGIDINIIRNSQTFILSDKYNTNLEKISIFLNQSKGQIYNKDYKDILAKAKADDFVFLDPPYIDDHKRIRYSTNEIIDESFIHELATEVKKLDNKGVKWMMTQANTPLIKKVFAQYDIKSYKVYRAISNSYTKELIIRNYT